MSGKCLISLPACDSDHINVHHQMCPYCLALTPAVLQTTATHSKTQSIIKTPLLNLKTWLNYKRQCNLLTRNSKILSSNTPLDKTSA